MSRPDAGALITVKDTPKMTELGIAGLHGVVERPNRAMAWVVVAGTRYGLFYDEFTATTEAAR